ncbi:MAG: beta-ketoacyl-ACP synthase I [Planctomycetota bacterium]|nr:MAG: beta-ketoacyl-ACP synthase I [Planctomycetota bacterium]
MRRVVITGMGAVSCLGNTAAEVLASLRAGRSGIVFNESYRTMGMRSHVAGSVDLDADQYLDRRSRRFMCDAAVYTWVAMREAMQDAGLGLGEISHPSIGVIASAGGSSSANVIESADALRSKGLRRVSPYAAPRTMGSNVSACLATSFQIKGMSYSITSACSSSAHCIGAAMEQVQWGKQDIVFAGGSEEEDWSIASRFDAMGALSVHSNESPGRASRPYDRSRDGFVIAAGAGMLVVEALEHALARGAKIYAELVGYGANSDGADMVAPSGEGAVRCMQLARATVDTPIDYVNTHGTSTPVGDLSEVAAMREVFGDSLPRFSSTKSMGGHSLGAAGALEAIHCLLMLEHDFIAPSINVVDPEPELEGLPLVTERVDHAGLITVMTNSFGFGGTNASLVFRRLASPTSESTDRPLKSADEADAEGSK